MPQWNALRSSLFAHPKAVSGAVWATSTFIFLVFTCVELTPLGNDHRNAKKRRNNAQDDYDNTLAQLNSAYSSLTEAKQRVVDLDCAMAGYESFNQRALAFQQKASTQPFSIDSLKLFWQLHFDADKSETQQTVESKSWKEAEYVWDYYYSCIWHTCSNQQSCCYGWGYHNVEQKYYYNEVTTITNIYQAIIEGTPLKLPALQCGYYSREFQTLLPVSYITHETPHITSGRREAGTVYIQFNREYGSSVDTSYTLDDKTSQTTQMVMRTTNQDAAATDLAAKLSQFLATAIAAFNMAGANYSLLQDNIRAQIPGLIDNAAAINTTLQEKALVLQERQADNADKGEEFHEGLSLWLPMLFLIPGGLALMTYLILTLCKDKGSAAPKMETPNDAENNITGKDVQPAYIPARLFSNPSASAPVENVAPPPPYDSVYSL